MYVTVQFIILEILLGLIFLVVLYFMVRELLKKIIRREIREVKEPLELLANYLLERTRQEAQDQEDPGGPDGPDHPGGPNTPGGRRGQAGQSAGKAMPASSPEKLPEEPVDVADEFVQLKNTNRISAYNIRVQKIWELYKQNKITLAQYRDELLRLKKEFGIATTDQEDTPAEKQPLNASKGVRLQPLTPTPSATPDEKVKNIDTEPEREPGTPDQQGDTTREKPAVNPGQKPGSSRQNPDREAGQGSDDQNEKDNKAASL